MTLELRCQDVGLACTHVERAETPDELVAAVGKHAEAQHGVELNRTLADYAVTRARPAHG